MKIGIMSSSPSNVGAKNTAQQLASGRIIKVAHALEEVAYVVETQLDITSAFTIVKALEFADDGAGDHVVVLDILPHKVPPHVMVTEIGVANDKFSPSHQEECQDLAASLDRQLQLNDAAGLFLGATAQSLAQQPATLGPNIAQQLPAAADTLGTRWNELYDQKVELLKQKQDLYTNYNKLDGELLVKVGAATIVGGDAQDETDKKEPTTIQLLIKCHKLQKSTFCSEYRYSSETQTGNFRQLFRFDSPFKSQHDVEEITIFPTDKIPSKLQTRSTTPPFQVHVANGQIQLQNLEVTDLSACTAQDMPIARLSNVSLSPGPNFLKVLDGPLNNIRYEAFPEQEPGKVFAIGEITNEWDSMIGGGFLAVFRDDAFVQSGFLPPIPPAQSMPIACGAEPKIALDLSTHTKQRNGKSPPNVCFLDVIHTAKVTSDFLCAVRIHLRVPQLTTRNDPTAKVKLVTADETPGATTAVIQERSLGFADPPAGANKGAPTIHLFADDPSVAVLRVLTPGNSCASKDTLTYRIQWQQQSMPPRRSSIFSSSVDGGAFPAGHPRPSPNGVPPTPGHTENPAQTGTQPPAAKNTGATLPFPAVSPRPSPFGVPPPGTPNNSPAMTGVGAPASFGAHSPAPDTRTTPANTNSGAPTPVTSNTLGAPAPAPTLASASSPTLSTNTAIGTAVANESASSGQKRAHTDGIEPRAKKSASPGSTPTIKDCRAMLVSLYQKHNSEKLGAVDSILAKYRGKEGALFLQLAQLYNVHPTEVGLSNVAKMPGADGPATSSPSVFGQPQVFGGPAGSGFGTPPSSMFGRSPFIGSGLVSAPPTNGVLGSALVDFGQAAGLGGQIQPPTTASVPGSQGDGGGSSEETSTSNPNETQYVSSPQEPSSHVPKNE